MASDPQLGSLLKWSIENANNPSGGTDAGARAPNAEALAALFSGKSDADLMRESMAAIQSDLPLDQRLIAWDNLEQLIEGIDNANNLTPLQMWGPLVAQLGAAEPEVAVFAAWCVGTAVQNNPAAQQRALDEGAFAALVKMVRGGDQAPRRKAARALSSAVRNFQPGMDRLLEELGGGGDTVDAGDMEAVDALVHRLREGEA